MTHSSFGQLTICLIQFWPNDYEICYIRNLLLSSNTSRKAHDLRA